MPASRFARLAPVSLAVLVLAACSLERSAVGRTGDGGARHDAGTDGGPLCHAGECDDGNPCTDDECQPSGCIYTANAATCNDGVLCNGGDTCSGATCRVHDGLSPCVGASHCEPSIDRCVGCRSDADCPVDAFGDYGACAFPTEPCPTMGARSRSRTHYTCRADSCEPSATTESEGCMRTTDGVTCAPTEYGMFGACGYADFCSQTGSRTRSATAHVCGGGACGSSAGSESTSTGCDRSTDDMSCGADIPGPWTPCGGFTDVCDETGTQSRMVSSPACAAGTCSGGMDHLEMQACTRTTAGMSCGSPACTLGACMQTSPGTCSMAGTQSRSCTPMTCMSGVCAGGAPVVDSVACSFPTDGDPCIGATVCGECMTSTAGCRFGEMGTRSCTRQTGACTTGACGDFLLDSYDEPCMCTGG